MLDCLRDMVQSVKDFFKRDWTMTEKLLVILCCVMFGIIEGFIMAPIKRGISCWNNNNGNVYNQLEDDYWLDDDDDEE